MFKVDNAAPFIFRIGTSVSVSPLRNSSSFLTVARPHRYGERTLGPIPFATSAAYLSFILQGRFIGRGVMSILASANRNSIVCRRGFRCRTRSSVLLSFPVISASDDAVGRFSI
jgi:hypothetical protein